MTDNHRDYRCSIVNRFYAMRCIETEWNAPVVFCPQVQQRRVDAALDGFQPALIEVAVDVQLGYDAKARLGPGPLGQRGCEQTNFASQRMQEAHADIKNRLIRDTLNETLCLDRTGFGAIFGATERLRVNSAKGEAFALVLL